MSKAKVAAHLAKAREFLGAAELALDAGYANSATSSAVTAAINAKDAICLHALGATGKSERHEGAVRELSRTGQIGRSLAPTLKRLLALKTPAQYAAQTVTVVNARKAVEWAQRMVSGAEQAVL